MGKVTKLKLPKSHEDIDYMLVEIHPSHCEGNLEVKVMVVTNKDEYHRHQVIPNSIFLSDFDRIFDYMKEEVKRFMIHN